MASNMHSGPGPSVDGQSPSHMTSTADDVFPLLNSLRSRPEFQQLVLAQKRHERQHKQTETARAGQVVTSRSAPTLSAARPTPLPAENRHASSGRASARPRNAQMLVNDFFGADVLRALEQGQRAESTQQRSRSMHRPPPSRAQSRLPTVNEILDPSAPVMRPYLRPNEQVPARFHKVPMASQSTSALPSGNKTGSLNRLTRVWSTRSARSSTSSSQTWKRASVKSSSDVSPWFEIGSPVSGFSSAQHARPCGSMSTIALDQDVSNRLHPQLQNLPRLETSRPTSMYDSYSRDESIGSSQTTLKRVMEGGRTKRARGSEASWWRRVKRALTLP
ncbi:hypothetical protein ACM66B_004350 [Microbotryomycetes sp. NB124-2]